MAARFKEAGLWLAILALLPFGARAQSHATAPAVSYARLANGIEASRAGVSIRVTALTDQILRVRVARRGRWPEDASWAVPAAARAQSVAVRGAPRGFSTKALSVVIGRRLALTVTDAKGRRVVADDPEPIRFSASGFTLRKALAHDEHIFGLGDKTGDLDRRGETFVDWNTDAYGYTSSTDPIYKSIPFYLGVGGPGGTYGILFDNTWRAWFDFGHREPDVTAFGAPDGPIDYYIIGGPSTAEVVRRYTDLTGRAPLPPLWSFGYQQSRYSYMTAQETLGVVERLRQEAFPTDVVWLDIDYQDRNRPFTVNRTAFPDMKALAAELADRGVRLVTIADLHVAAAPGQGYSTYDTGLAANDFVHNPDGSVFVGTVWPGPSVFPDFTDGRVRKWWGRQYAALVADHVAGFWDDMNEPSVFQTANLSMPLDTVHRIDSDDFAARTATHAEIHNVYGMENSRATFEGLQTLRPDERPFVMTRATYAGGQRYAVTWTGDDGATWDHLKLMVHQLINLGLSGFSYAGADVGGFTGGASPELMTRWFEIGAFTPIFRDHAAKGTPRAEPWVDGPEQLAIRRRFVDERYRLMPYLYSLADESSRTGDPLMRPVFYDYPQALTTACDQSMAFTLGPSILVAPPPKPESPHSYDICLPAGGWFDLWTGRRVTPAEGDAIETIRAQPRLDQLPVFVRAGSILPSQPLVQSTADTPDGPLGLDVYLGADCHGAIYLDDGHSLEFRSGHFLRQQLRCSVARSGALQVVFQPREGDVHPWWRSITLTVHGWKGGATATYAGHDVPVVRDADHGSLRLELPDIQSGAVEITPVVGATS
ncbi:MAG TPA: TIM-barrel domain-containing protein [Caulobacteraceae bacterium]